MHVHQDPSLALFVSISLTQFSHLLSSQPIDLVLARGSYIFIVGDHLSERHLKLQASTMGGGRSAEGSWSFLVEGHSDLCHGPMR
jgi:hypothetical protein